MEVFVNKFCELYDLPLEEAGRMLDRMELITCNRGECLVHEGERNNCLYIIVKGIWRGFYMRDGVDVSIWFAVAGEAIFSTWGYVIDRPSLITIEAMTDSTLYKIPRESLDELFSESVAFANFGRKLFERQFLDVETWMVSGGAAHAKERYLTLMEEKPELLQYVPLKYIASYLYITPQSLSRIRSELARGSRQH